MITDKFSQYIVIGLIFALIVVGAAGFLRPTVISQLAEENRLDVTGTATLNVEPDEVIILVGAETQAASADDAQRSNAGVISVIRSTLSRMGLSSENVTTAMYSLEPVREYNKTTDTVELVGYKTTHMLMIKSAALDKAGDYVDAAVNGEANRIDSVTFSLSDAKQVVFRAQALTLAGQNAKAKADASAQGLSVSVKRVVRASEGYVSITPFASQLRAGAEVATATEITPGQVQVSASISVTYEIG